MCLRAAGVGCRAAVGHSEASLTHFLFSAGGDKLALVTRNRLIPSAQAVGYWGHSRTSQCFPAREGGHFLRHTSGLNADQARPGQWGFWHSPSNGLRGNVWPGSPAEGEMVEEQRGAAQGLALPGHLPHDIQMHGGDRKMQGLVQRTAVSQHWASGELSSHPHSC